MDNIKKQTILCVDDDKKNLKLLELTLAPQGYTLKFSGSGADALAQIAEEIPDLILLDVMMPAMSGLDVLELLRKDEKTRLIPVVLLTALSAEEDRMKGLAAGCDDFLSKPFNMIELIVRVRSLLRISNYRSSLDEKEKLWRIINEMSEPLIVCRPDWVIINLNQSAQRFLVPGMEFENINFLDFTFEHYSVSVPWKELNDCVSAPKKFRIERKDSERPAIQRAEVHLEIYENTAHVVENIVLKFKDIAGA
jgi:CheY-like chemotaxis protein